METASFVEKEPSKVAVRFIGWTLHYERNHLLPRAEITAVHHKQSTFIKSLQTVATPPSNLLQFLHPSQCRACARCARAPTQVQLPLRGTGICRVQLERRALLRSPDAHTVQHRCKWTAGMSDCAHCFQDYQFFISFSKVQVHDTHEKSREQEEKGMKEKFRELESLKTLGWREHSKIEIRISIS